MALFAPVDTANLNGGSGDKKRVAYFYDSDVGNYAYVAGHPMKPHRIRMAHSLVMNYGMYKKMEIYRAKPASKFEMTQFHTDEYVEFLQKVTPDNMDSYAKEQTKFNVGDDCPVFDGLFEFCAISAGGSMEGAARLNRGKADVAINWAGGLHHAKKSEASGFCYINDIVLGIIELLRFKQRVLYIDIDVHHGDGVEEAFYTTDRVMCVSFHKYGEYFPGTGELRDIGVGQGKYYSVNFPLRDGIDDAAYKGIFEPVIKAVMDWYRPEAVVLQCGGDSLSGDRLGCFNLSMEGHANCVNFVKSYNLPTLILGGGGYTMRNVARTWAFETGVLVGQNMQSDLPYNDYYEYYAPDYELNVRASNMDNANSKEYLEKIRTQVIENLRRTTFAPSVQMTDVPRDSMAMNEEDEAELDDLDEDQNPDKRNTQHRFNKYIEKPGELSDSEDEEMNEANGVRKQPGIRKRRNRLDYRNLTDWNGDSAITSGAATPQAASSIPENDVDGDVNVEDVEPAKTQEQSTASPANAANGDMDASVVPSTKPANEEEDVAMEDVGNEAAEPPTDTSGTIVAQHTANVQQAVTPPYSPVGFATTESSTNGETSGAAGPTIKTEMTAEDAAVVAQGEGLADREVQNAEGEAAAEHDSKIS
ncbi:hypothetical protein EPUS_08444 [Endocarpon pusillum Z07020]|uniref:histone deacetylase n=1 Tax=Endocarpon pusillum (strain Z07020 / HMAS-L-300199) TaxID=1263415 RepID=U1I0X5_ENDPU|nr:uncharacterized protein EPUS_08444 [Endocarpon pusillum Z07020]ERF75539.1 hypothetical protein EPUS_08444 [Endocarpon pusillum Z07020]